MKMRTSILVSCVLAIAACSSGIKKADISTTANPAAEIDRIRQEQITARDEQVDVLSPEFFLASQRYLREAESDLKDQKSGSQIVESLEYSQGALNQARLVAKQAGTIIPEVIEARKRAVDAQAVKFQPDQLRTADRDLSSMTRRFEDGKFAIDQKDRLDLESAYFRIEQTSVTAARLGRARNIYSFAKKNDAERLSPKNFSDLEARLREAELKIGASMRDKSMLNVIEQDINARADHLLRVLQAVHKAKNEPMEQFAAERIMEQDALFETREDLKETQESLSETESRKNELENKQKINKALRVAQSKLSPNEAEVSIQGDQLVMKLKGVNFPFGRAELPGSSMTILSKVKDVLAQMPADKSVVVQGHTDSVGSPELNQKLSQSRAEAVSQYLISESAIHQDQISAQGAGYEQPIASNKKSMGRKENRRVDIIVTPSSERKATEQTGKEVL